MLGRPPPRRKFSWRRPALRPLRVGNAALIGTRACRLQRQQRCLNRHEGVPAPKTATLLTIGTRACRLQRRQGFSQSARGRAGSKDGKAAHNRHEGVPAPKAATLLILGAARKTCHPEPRRRRGTYKRSIAFAKECVSTSSCPSSVVRCPKL